MKKRTNTGAQTKAVHAARAANRTRAVGAPIWQTSTFRADSAAEFIEMATTPKSSEFYTRYGNPTHEQVEMILCALENGESALVTASGMGAIFNAVLSHVSAGDHIIAQRNIYANTSVLFSDYLPRWNVECTFVDQTDADAFERAIKPNTKLIYVETPSNPLMILTDLRRVADIGMRHNIPTIVDGTFATPINQRPLELGITAVVHSATKYLGGHHDLTAGAIIGSREFVERAWKLNLLSGSILSPFDGWLLLRGLRTLSLRVERHNQNALAVARFLESHEKVARVYYPGLETHPQHELARAQMHGFTGMLSVELTGGFNAAEQFIKNLELAIYAASLGGFETLVVHPAAMWQKTFTAEQRAEIGVSDGLVRISIGLEDEADLLADFAQALQKG